MQEGVHGGEVEAEPGADSAQEGHQVAKLARANASSK
jgi:hypothetical protein